MSLIEITFMLVLALIAGAVLVQQRTLLRISAQREQDDAARHKQVLDALNLLRHDVEIAGQRQEQRNLEQLAAALSDVIADFDRRIVVQFNEQLTALTALTDRSAEAGAKQRHEQMEAMHHARRLADRMDAAATDFGKLVAENSEMLALSGQVRETLSLLGARQDALDGDILRQAESLEAMGGAVRDLRAGFEQAIEQMLLQVRRSLDAMAQRQAQGNGALQKDLNDLLNKAIAGMSRQLSAVPPMSPQAKLQTFR